MDGGWGAADGPAGWTGAEVPLTGCCGNGAGAGAGVELGL